MYNKQTVESWSWFDDDWTSGHGTVMMQAPDTRGCSGGSCNVQEWESSVIVEK